jgi:predicted AAA+ superfamily ATPase
MSNPDALRKAFPSDFRPLEHFNAYLKKGYYPFFQESYAGYHQRLQQLGRTIVEYDMAELKGFDIRNAKKMLQLLYIIAQHVPFQPNLSSLASKSKIHRNSLNNYFHFLEEARLIGLLYPSGISVATLQKPEKIFLNNTDLLFALSAEHPNKGTVREVFFYSQVKVAHRLTQPKKGDFQIDEQYTFEIGGKDKTSHQLQATENARLVKDDLEYPASRALPLWAFGFLY